MAIALNAKSASFSLLWWYPLCTCMIKSLFWAFLYIESDDELPWMHQASCLLRSRELDRSIRKPMWTLGEHSKLLWKSCCYDGDYQYIFFILFKEFALIISPGTWSSKQTSFLCPIIIYWIQRYVFSSSSVLWNVLKGSKLNQPMMVHITHLNI